jgi:catechol 2,3-dioxygenase-like lactoylglutathione lyase family enzyme
VRIREVVLPAPDPAALGRAHESAYGATRLRFEPGPAVCSHFAVNVPPERFEEAVAWAGERFTVVEEDVPFPAWRARAAYFFDPGGNIVELIARERAPGDELFLEVSEVGLPVSDVDAAVDWLEAVLGLPRFDVAPGTFGAMGDDRGLFIVVPVGRHWLFTEEPAADVPVQVTIADAELRPARTRPSRALAHGAELVVPGSGHVVRLGSG